MTWNYRMLEWREEGEEPVLEIVEVFYRSDGAPLFWSKATAMGDDEEEVQRVLMNMIGALSHPILKESDFKEEP